MGKFLYTIVCRYYTINGIIELDLYEVFMRLRIKPIYDEDDDIFTWKKFQLYSVVMYHVNTGQAVEYVIKKVLRKIDWTTKTKQLYSYYEPYSLMYDCIWSLDDVEMMNYESIAIRMRMSDEEFNKIYGRKLV